MLEKLYLSRNRIGAGWKDGVASVRRWLKEFTVGEGPMSAILVGDVAFALEVVKEALRDRPLQLFSPLLGPFKASEEIVIVPNVENCLQNQRTLYTLFSEKILCICLTENVNIVASLEKRVRSRFSQNIHVLARKMEVEAFLGALRKVFGLKENLLQKHRHALTEALKDGVEAALDILGELLLEDCNVAFERGSMLFCDKLSREQRKILKKLSESLHRVGKTDEELYGEYLAPKTPQNAQPHLLPAFFRNIEELAEMGFWRKENLKYSLAVPLGEIEAALRKCAELGFLA